MACQESGAEHHRRRVLDRHRLSLDGHPIDVNDTALSFISHSGTLAPGATYTAQATPKLPNGISGPFYILVRTDYSNQVFEAAQEGNNVSQPQAINVSLKPAPDLTVTNITAPSS